MTTRLGIFSFHHFVKYACLLASMALLSGCQLDVLVTGQGKVTSEPAGIDCGLSASQCSVKTQGSDAAFRLTAQAADGYHFSHWEGACSGSEPVCDLRVLMPSRVTAHFQADSGGGDTVVSRYGHLRVEGSQLVSRQGTPIQLKGMSSHGLHWYGHYMNHDSMKWLRDDWRASVLRAAMYTAEGGYISNPSIKDKVIEVVENAIALGVYVIIDWHILYDNNPNQYKTQAKAFFREMAQRFGHAPNVIYEIANEPNGDVTWQRDIKPYAQEVIAEIRAVDPDNIILVGTGTWSQDVHHAANDQLAGRNLMYVVHFYAGTHGQWLRDRIDYALGRGAPVFVSEWGASQASGDGGVYEADTRAWVSFMANRKISWANWSLADKQETSAALAPGADTRGGWQSWELSASGRLVRELMRQ